MLGLRFFIYIFKYVNKGLDRIGAKIKVDNEVTCEAVWRILGYDIHHREHLWRGFRSTYQVNNTFYGRRVT